MTSKLVIRESECPRPGDSDFMNDEFLGHYPLHDMIASWTVWKSYTCNYDPSMSMIKYQIIENLKNKLHDEKI